MHPGHLAEACLNRALEEKGRCVMADVPQRIRDQARPRGADSCLPDDRFLPLGEGPQEMLRNLAKKAGVPPLAAARTLVLMSLDSVTAELAVDPRQRTVSDAGGSMDGP